MSGTFFGNSIQFHQFIIMWASQLARKNQINNVSSNFDDLLSSSSRQNSSYRQYFQEDDSLLSLNSIMPETQYRELSHILHTKPQTIETTAQKFYHKGYDSCSPYYVEYLEWKERKDKDENFTIKLSREEKVNGNQKQQKHLDLEFLRQSLQNRNQAKSIEETKIKMKLISDQYKQKVKNALLNSKSSSLPKRAQKLNIEQIKFPNFQDTQTPKLAPKLEEQIKHTTFVSLIKHPPRQKEQFKPEDIPIESELPSHQSQKQIVWKLDIAEIMKMPYRQFLIFFNYYEIKINALATPEQLKLLNKYRKQALKSQEALAKLKKKLDSSGPQVVEKLSPQKKRKLFELLYEDQLQEQIAKSYFNRRSSE